MEGISVILSELSPELSAGLLLLTAVVGYLLGNCNGAVMVSKLLFHDDVRTHGSGNGGLTNFHRTYGGRWVTIVVIAVDMLKVVASVAIAWAVFSRFMPHGYVPLFVKYWAGIFTVIGHVFPFALKFHGGKGILAGGTLALLVDWRVAVCAWGCFLIGVILTRWVSMGSLLAATAFGVSSALFHPTPSIAIPALLAGALIDWKHRENFKRLLAGTESRLTFQRAHDPKEDLPPEEETDLPESGPSPEERPEELPEEVPEEDALREEELQPAPEPRHREDNWEGGRHWDQVDAWLEEEPQPLPEDRYPEDNWEGGRHWDQVDAWLEDHPGNRGEDAP